MKTTSSRLFVAAGLLACMGSLAMAQTASKRTKAKPKPAVSAAPSPVAVTPVANTVPAPSPTIPPAAPSATETTPAAAPPPSPAPEAPVSTDDTAARAALKAGSEANGAGNIALAVTKWREALSLAPAGEAGDPVSLEATRRLWFAARESRNPQQAEVFAAATAVLARRLYYTNRTSTKTISDAYNNWADAAHYTGKSSLSVALSRFSSEIRTRAQANLSSQLLNRDVKNPADEVQSVRVSTEGACVVATDAILKGRVSCDDEAGAQSEALASYGRQVNAVPPPPTKEEREAKAAKAKKGGG